MAKVLKFLSGKKSTIASLIMTFVAYIGAKGMLAPDDIVFIGSMVTLLFGSTSLATNIMFDQEKKNKGFSKITNYKI